MFVTSDIFDLENIGRFRGFAWRETLVCGINFYGTVWRGPEAMAEFYLEAAKRCGFLSEIRHAGYGRPDSERSHSIKPTSFERLARGELAGAQNAHSLLFRGEREAVGTESGWVVFGGAGGARPPRIRTLSGPVPVVDYPFSSFSGDFLFPWFDMDTEKAIEILQLSVGLLGVEYGYYFIRDDFCLPMAYCSGIGAPLDYSPLSNDDACEISDWQDFHRAGRLWTGQWPLFRDLFSINLISERHTSVPVDELGYLTDWISAEPGRGELRDLGHGCKLWILTDVELFNIRPSLMNAGILHSCRPRVYRDLPQSPGNQRVPGRLWPAFRPTPTQSSPAASTSRRRPPD